MAVLVDRSTKHSRNGFFSLRILADAAGGTIVISTDGLFRPGITNLGLCFFGESPGAATIAIAYTQSPAEQAINRDSGAVNNVTWQNIIPSLTLATETRDSTWFTPTAIKVTFAGGAAAALNVSLD